VFGNCVWRWRTAGDADVDREHVLERARELGGIAEDVATQRAVAECG
jgi:hypothetical protein